MPLKGTEQQRDTLSQNEVSLVEEILKEKSLAAFSNAQEIRKKEQDYLELEEQIFFPEKAPDSPYEYLG